MHIHILACGSAMCCASVMYCYQFNLVILLVVQMFALTYHCTVCYICILHGHCMLITLVGLCIFRI